MTEVTGPKASTLCSSGASGAAATSTVGAKKAPRSRSPEASSSRSGPPTTTSAPRPSSATARPTSASWPRLTSGPMVVSSSRGSPTRTSASRSASASTTAPTRPAGTSARRMAVHFCPVFWVSSRTTSVTNSRSSSVPGAASGPRTEQFSLPDHGGVAAQLAGGGRRPGEGDGVLAGEVVEQVADAAAQQLDRPRGQRPRLDQVPEGQLGHVGGLAGRLDDRRDAGEHGRGQLLQHPPDREVEGVDEHRHPGPGAVDALADEGPAPAQRLRRPLDPAGMLDHPAQSTPVLDTRATASPVEASTRVVPSSPAVYQSSRT